MNNIITYDAFHFYEINLYNYHHTDNRSGAPDHYIAIMNKGHCRLVSDNRTVEISEGDVFYIPMGLSYQSYWYGNSEISFKSLGFRLFPETREKVFRLQKLDCDNSIKEKINKITVNKEVDSRIISDFFNILNELLPIMEAEPLSRDELIYTVAHKYITKNIDCRANDIARYCGISESTLYSVFKSVAKKTPNEVKNEILCEKAAFLLTTTDKSVQEISDSLNFSSTSYFRKILKAHTGKKPLEIRKESDF